MKTKKKKRHFCHILYGCIQLNIFLKNSTVDDTMKTGMIMPLQKKQKQSGVRDTQKLQANE